MLTFDYRIVDVFTELPLEATSWYIDDESDPDDETMALVCINNRGEWTLDISFAEGGCSIVRAHGTTYQNVGNLPALHPRNQGPLPVMHRFHKTCCDSINIDAPETPLGSDNCLF